MKNKRIEKLIEPSPLSLLLPVAVSALLWAVGNVFRPEQSWDVTSSGVIDHLFRTQIGLSEGFSTVLAWTFYVFQAIVLVRMNDRFMLINRRTMLPLAFFLLLISVNENLRLFSLSQVSLLLLVQSMGMMFATYRQRDRVSEYFIIGITMSVSVLLTAEYVVFVPFILIGALRLNALSLRSLLAFLTGLATVPLSLVTLAYVFMPSTAMLGYMNGYVDTLSFAQPHYKLNFVKMTFYASIFFVSMFSLLRALRRDVYDNVRSQCYYAVTRNFFLISVFLLFFMSERIATVYPLAALFASMILAHYFSLNESIVTRCLFWLVVISSMVFFLYSLLF